HGLNIKWVAAYCGTSLQMIEKHYSRYIKNDSHEQLKRLFEGRPETFDETLPEGVDAEDSQLVNALQKEMVGASGFEPPTSRTRTVRSTKLSHAPTRPT
ncbi:MAG: hypothetical protein QOF64_724, partial [Candidatus Binatota bacterium]|nr:hypothetical protein [Candidatus Binatota bacterium]